MPRTTAAPSLTACEVGTLAHKLVAALAPAEPSGERALESSKTQHMAPIKLRASEILELAAPWQTAIESAAERSWDID